MILELDEQRGHKGTIGERLIRPPAGRSPSAGIGPPAKAKRRAELAEQREAEDMRRGNLRSYYSAILRSPPDLVVLSVDGQVSG